MLKRNFLSLLIRLMEKGEMKLKIWALIVGCIVALSSQVCVAAPILSVDFSGADIADNNNGDPGTDTPLQSGYVAWAGTYFGNPGSNINETRSFGADFGVGGVVDVTVRSDALFFRDYDPIVGGPFLAQSALLSDNILRNRPGSIFLSFDSLMDGVYTMKSFHHDTRHGSSFIPFDIILTDSLVSNQTLFSGLDTTGGTSPSTVLMVDYEFTVVGGSSVIIEFSGQAQNAQHMSINGFQLQRIGDAPILGPIPLDIKPQSCPNPLNVKSKGVLTVSILGLDNFDVTEVDIASLRLEGVAPHRSALEDVATPFVGVIDDALDCTDEGPDGFDDLTLKFKTQEVVAVLGTISDGDVLVLRLTGNLLDGTPIAGEDVVILRKKGNN